MVVPVKSTSILFALRPGESSPRGFETGIGTALGTSATGFSKFLFGYQSVPSEKVYPCVR